MVAVAVPASAAQPSLPIRGTFYYPWFPETWGDGTHYHPQLGRYDSADAVVVDQHIAWMRYAGSDAGIASWWGPGTLTDSRISLLESRASGTGFKWTLYYEDEGWGNPPAATVDADLGYIRRHYVRNHPQFLRVNAKPVLFVYGDAGDGCGMVNRWATANRGRFYVVLKVFPGFASCSSQPNSWHQYGPSTARHDFSPYSYTISPGFWFTPESQPRLARNLDRWRADVAAMVASGADWQLITTFNEWGEGTAIEPASEWGSAYLDALKGSP